GSVERAARLDPGSRQHPGPSRGPQGELRVATARRPGRRSLVTPVQLEAARIAAGPGPSQADRPLDRLGIHGQVEHDVRLAGHDRLGKRGIAEAEPAALDSNDEPALGVLANDRLERLVEVHGPVRRALDLEVALEDSQGRASGPSEENLPEVPVEDGP